MPESQTSIVHSLQAGWLPERKKNKDAIELLGTLEFLPQKQQEGKRRGKENTFYAEGNLRR